ncbi:MAG: type IX secretion system membrane protein PorP/SprF [Flavobacteriaceae bacterium]|nr:type IX secretion system membrane protein PorP/SprF [Flavobacteriaceae bacterium]
MRKSIITVITIIITLVLIHKVEAQQDPNFSLYHFNMNLLNPAYAGAEANEGFTMAYRKQWLGIPGAPKSISATYSWNARKNLGFAINVYSNKYSITNRVNFSTDISYHIQLAEERKLYFGLKVGGGFFNVDFTKILTPVPDPIFSENVNAFNMHLGFGLYLSDAKYFVSVSTPNFIKEKIGENNTAEGTNFYLSGGYHFTLNENIVITPRAMMRLLSSYENTFDFGASVDVYRKFTFGANYNTSEMFTLYALFKVIDKASIGFSYDTVTSSVNNFDDDGSLDVILKYKF